MPYHENAETVLHQRTGRQQLPAQSKHTWKPSFPCQSSPYIHGSLLATPS